METFRRLLSELLLMLVDTEDRKSGNSFFLSFFLSIYLMIRLGNWGLARPTLALDPDNSTVLHRARDSSHETLPSTLTRTAADENVIRNYMDRPD